VLRIDGTAETGVTATPARCLEVLAAVEDYPAWSSLIAGVELLGDGTLLIRAQVLGLSVRMTCALDLGADRAVLRRLPHDPDDDESFEATFTITPVGNGSGVELHTVAAFHVPGPASMLRGRVTTALVDDLLADFARAV
jgi:hypothetical protein